MAIDFPLDDRIRPFRYPGGEWAVAFGDGGRPEADRRHVGVVTGATPDDLVVLAVWANDVRRAGGRPIALVPYLPGARADHADRTLGFDAAAYAALLGAADLDGLVCVDPHSPVLPRLLADRGVAVDVVEAADLVAEALAPSLRERLVGVIAPDDGAAHRAALVAERIGVPTFQAHKHRDFDTGRLSGFSCEPVPADGDLLVVDDICDGGGTFRGLAEAVPDAAGRLHLWVSHGVFSGEAPRLADHFRSITTTDSHPGCHNIPGTRIHPLLPTLLGRLETGATP